MGETPTYLQATTIFFRVMALTGPGILRSVQMSAAGLSIMSKRCGQPFITSVR